MCSANREASYYNATIGGKTEVHDVAWYVAAEPEPQHMS